MYPLINTMFYLVFAWLVGVCYGFVLISSAARQTADLHLFGGGESAVYQLHSTVLTDESVDSAKNVGFYIVGHVQVCSAWAAEGRRVLKVELKAPRLHIKSRKAPSPDGFIQHKAHLDDFELKPTYLVWNRGKIEQLLLPKHQPVALANLNKGIASLFQFQLLDTKISETDSSGVCQVSYKSLDTNKIEKTKTNCVSNDFPRVRNTEKFLDTPLQSSRTVHYELNLDDSYIKTIASKETHKISLSINEDWGTSIAATQILNFVKRDKCDTVAGDNVDQVLKTLTKNNKYDHHSLLTEKEPINIEDSKNFATLVNDLRENLADKHLGGVTSAKSFIRLLSVARQSTKEEIAKVLDAKKNKNVLPQLYDLLGYVQTVDSHKAVVKRLHFERDDHLDLSERYLWALSFAQHPNPEIVTDLLNRYRKNDNYPEKIKETFLLTLASMTHHLKDKHKKISRNVGEIILNGLDYAKDEQRFMFLRALKNLQAPSTIPALLHTIKNGTNKEGALAFKALTSFDQEFFDDNVVQTATNSFFEIDRLYDSSSRTLAVDVLLKSNPSHALLRDFFNYLKSNDSSFEVSQYLQQQIHRLKDEDQALRRKLFDVFERYPSLNSYHFFAPQGLSTALTRNLWQTPSSNGSLLAIQEVFAGIVKRGIVNIMLDNGGENKEIFSLGIFAGGLSSLVLSNPEDDDVATAGLDLTVLGTQIRPFVFFTGQGELMGHVWSGTASERTPAFQALILQHDYSEYLRLGPGFIAELDVKGALSFDLSGQVEISLWNRNAESLVEKSAGVSIVGLTRIDTSFVRTQVEFSVAIEPKLSLKSFIEFSTNKNLCMKLSQPDLTIRHNIFKIERIPGSKHKLRFAKYKKRIISGLSYALNKKNDDKCNEMFKEQ